MAADVVGKFGLASHPDPQRLLTARFIQRIPSERRINNTWREDGDFVAAPILFYQNRSYIISHHKGEQFVSPVALSKELSGGRRGQECRAIGVICCFMI